jgi:hypothetical protein
MLAFLHGNANVMRAAVTCANEKAITEINAIYRRI